MLFIFIFLFDNETKFIILIFYLDFNINYFKISMYVKYKSSTKNNVNIFLIYYEVFIIINLNDKIFYF